MTHEPTPFPKLIDTHGAADLSGLSEALLITLRKEQKGPKCIKIGRQYLYDPETVAAWRKDLNL